MGNASRQFVMGVAESQKVQSISRIVDMDTYLTEFVDGEGKKKVSIVFQPKNSETCFIMNQQVGGVKIVTDVHDWFQKAFNQHIEEKGLTTVGAGDDDGVAQI